MKTFFALHLLLQAASLASAHYTFPSLIVNGQTTGEYQYVRMTVNRYSNSPVTDVSSSDMTCYAPASSGASTQTASVSAGDTVGFAVNPDIYHPGPLLFYMAKVPDGRTASNFDGSGAVWFKIYQNEATITSSSISWPSGQKAVTVKIPSCIPSGQYLIRVEHIGLHGASSPSGAQLYIACGQLNVSGGGSTPGSPTVSFPGAYSPNDPGLLLNIYYPVPQSYTPPGPPVFSCGGGGGNPATTVRTTTTSRTTTPVVPTTTSRTTTTTSRVTTTTTTTTSRTTTTTSRTTTATTTVADTTGPAQAKWGQCGGSGWTGPTVCQSPSRCVVQNSYYSQCQ